MERRLDRVTKSTSSTKKHFVPLVAKTGNTGDAVFRILMLLSQKEDPLTMSELSSELNVPMSTATRIVNGLVQGGMVERVNDANDRRVVRVGMSKNGRDLYEAGISYNKQRIAKWLKDFTTEEQAELMRLMNKLFDAVVNEA